VRTLSHLVLALILPVPLAAQWQASIEGALETIRGVTRTAEPGGVTFGIHHPAWIGVRLESPGGKARWSAGLSYAAPALVLNSPEATIIEHEGFTTVTALRTGVIIPLVRLESNVTLRAEAGPVLEWWRFEGNGVRLRAGGEVGASLEVGLGGRCSGTLAGILGVTPVSPLEAADLPEGIEPRSAWRQALRGSLRFAL
jgi:hypothetical protein